MLYLSLPIYFLVIGAALCAPEQVQETQEQKEPDSHIAPLEKRSPRYDFGLGKRAYSYVSEYKRLPVYNFGLGKRSRPYSFGLGKRSVDESQSDEDFSNDIDQATVEDLLEQYDDSPGYEVQKRARPYSFGLGKRYADLDVLEDKRAGNRLYDFGLGKRLPLYNFGLGKRAKAYNFGLGKRFNKFNFGLGKRQRDLHRFSFGLGKRSVDESIEDTDDLDL